jgi:hypothetical protein
MSIHMSPAREDGPIVACLVQILNTHGPTSPSRGPSSASGRTHGAAASHRTIRAIAALFVISFDPRFAASAAASVAADASTPPVG